MAQQFMNCKIKADKVMVFIKPTCSYCRKTVDLLKKLPLKQESLESVNITAHCDTNVIQDYFQQLTGARTVLPVFIGKDCIGGCSDLVALEQNGQLLQKVPQIGELQ